MSTEPEVYAYYVCTNNDCAEYGIYKTDTVSGVIAGPVFTEVRCGRCNQVTEHHALVEPVPLSQARQEHPLE